MLGSYVYIYIYIYTYKTALKFDKEVESFFFCERLKRQNNKKKIEAGTKNSKSKFSIGKIKIASKNRSREYKCTIGTKCSPKGFPKRKSERLLSVSPKANSNRQA